MVPAYTAAKIAIGEIVHVDALSDPCRRHWERLAMQHADAVADANDRADDDEVMVRKKGCQRSL